MGEKHNRSPSSPPYTVLVDVYSKLTGTPSGMSGYSIDVSRELCKSHMTLLYFAVKTFSEENHNE